ncbi:MAG: peptidoglycan synthetase, partial [Maribacter sp.]|nr:peptidoglycan synthetase [Maribacter sp.]
IACLELHTYSSFNPEFLKEYRGSLDAADLAAVFYLPESVKIKRLKEVSSGQIATAFERDDLQIFTNAPELKEFLLSLDYNDAVLLLMSSGNYGGLDLNLLKNVIENK